ncbi:MAG TPA: ABC transporter permease [Acidimicrobiales bacterium]|nr:ABC transporter permease [Acidimicrobiales bacterium]
MPAAVNRDGATIDHHSSGIPVTDVSGLGEVPPPELRFRRRVALRSALSDLWRARELVRSLTERQLRARYKQASLGVAWAVITPLVYMIVFTLFFNRVAEVDTGGAPYALFSYIGLLPWTFFSTSVSQAALSLVTNMSLLNKVSCPREVFPLSSVASAGVDTAIATLVLGLLFVVTGYAPRATSVWIPVLALIGLAFTTAVSLVLGVLTVYLRDLRHVLPIFLQVGLFATPVAYGIEVVPANLRGVYSALNPIAPVIDGLRRAVLEGHAPRTGLVVIAALSSAVQLFVGYRVFKRLETGVADVA